jgi:putative ABC transport system permease protein
MRELLRRFHYFFTQRRREAELAEEMALHAELCGRRAFGSSALAGDRSRDVWVPRSLQGLGHDFRLAVRALFANRIVSGVAILSLALGIGANTAIFSLVNSLLLRPLPVMDPQRLTIVTGGGSPNQAYPNPTWEELKKRAGAFGGMGAFRTTRFDLAQGGEGEFVDGVSVSGEFFATLGVPALIGRTFTASDDVRGGGRDGRVAVISHAFWQTHFGGALDVIGRVVTIERMPATIVGITPPDFFGPEVGRAFDVALPISFDETFLDRRTTWMLSVFVRLRKDQSLDTATAALRAMQPQIREAAMPHDASPGTRADFLAEPLTLVPAASGTSALRQRYQRPLLTLLVVVGLVLLIACANIASLLLARATARRREMSVRLALGGSPWRIGRQLFAESLTLAALGAGGGLLFAVWGSRALVGQLSLQFFNRVALDLTFDWRVLAFTSAVTIATTVLFGTAPAYRAAHIEPIDSLNQHGNYEVARVGLSGGLVVAQVALSLILVVAAGLFVRTFVRLTYLPLGFDGDRVIVVSADLGHVRVTPADRLALFARLTAAVARVPGVERAASSMITPVSGAYSMRPVDISGSDSTPARDRLAAFNFITPGWFATYGTPLRAGRDINARDEKDAPAVAIVNEAFAHRFLPGRDPLGATVRTPIPGSRMAPIQRVIVGVAADAVYRSLREPAPPTMYVPLAQWDLTNPLGGGNISIRAAHTSPRSLTHAIATSLTAVNRDLGLIIRPLSDQIDASFAQERMIALLSGFFGVLALLLAGLGLYGVTAYAVSRRRREIGIRMALGSGPRGVIRLVLSRVSILIAAGIVIGTGVSLWASKFVAALLYGVEPRDPGSLVGAAVILATVGAFAGWLPARRASRIDPAAVLRTE